MQETSNIQRQVTVTCENGLHLNPISQLVRRAVAFSSTISLSFDGRRADVKSAFDLMLLAAPAGAVLDLEISGADAPQAAEAICQLFYSGFVLPGLIDRTTSSLCHAGHHVPFAVVFSCINLSTHRQTARVD